MPKQHTSLLDGMGLVTLPGLPLPEHDVFTIFRTEDLMNELVRVLKCEFI